MLTTACESLPKFCTVTSLGLDAKIGRRTRSIRVSKRHRLMYAFCAGREGASLTAYCVSALPIVETQSLLLWMRNETLFLAMVINNPRSFVIKVNAEPQPKLNPA